MRLALIRSVAVPALLLVATSGQGRFGGGRQPQREAVAPPPTDLPYDGRFTFARLTYTCYLGCYYYRNEPSWAHGYPEAEVNLLNIMNSVTNMRPRRDGTKVIAMDDPQLFRYPVSYMTEAGYWQITDKEVAALNKYLLKGGFVKRTALVPSEFIVKISSPPSRSEMKVIFVPSGLNDGCASLPRLFVMRF